MLQDQLKQLRLKHGYSQEKVAEHLGVSRQAVTKWESGQSTPSSKNLMALADLYHIPLDELLGHSESTAPSNAAAKAKNPILQSNLTLIAIMSQTVFLSVATQHRDYTNDTTLFVTMAALIYLPLLASSIWMAANHRYTRDLAQRKRNTRIELVYCLIQATIAVTGYISAHAFGASVLLMIVCLVYVIEINPRYMNRTLVKRTAKR